MTEGERNADCGERGKRKAHREREKCKSRLVGGGRFRLKRCPCSIGYCSAHILPTLALSLSLGLHICILCLNSVCGTRYEHVRGHRARASAVLDGKVESSWRGGWVCEILWLTSGGNAVIHLECHRRQNLAALSNHHTQKSGGRGGLQRWRGRGWNKHFCRTVATKNVCMHV